MEPHVLRYWESEFPTIRPQKSRSGQRVYSRRDVEKLLRVKELLYAQRFTIAGARQRLRNSASATQALADTPPMDTPAVDTVRVAQSTGDPSCRRESVVDGSAEAEGVASNGTRAAATVLRLALLGMREQLVELLDDLERGGREPSR